MKIFARDNTEILDVIITHAAEHEEELMKSDFVKLSWDDVDCRELPVDAYIIPFSDGVKYSLLEPYNPEQKSECEWHYEPHFEHPKMYLGKVPFVRPTKDADNNDITLLDWSYVGSTLTLLKYICSQIDAALGLPENTAEIQYQGKTDDIISVTFSTQDILSALSNVANIAESEWHIEWLYNDQKQLHIPILYFSKQVTIQETIYPKRQLTVGDNINPSSNRDSKEGYYNAFLPQGSTRNITRRTASGEDVQSNVRLDLRDYVYTDGNKTIEFEDGIIYTDGNGNIISKNEFDRGGQRPYIKSLIFEDVFPHLDLYVYNVRYRERWLLEDEDNPESKVIDKYDGNVPVYKKYAVWYMKLAYPTTNEHGNVVSWNYFTDVLEERNYTYNVVKVVRKRVVTSMLSGYVEFIIDLDFDSSLFVNRSATEPGTDEHPYYVVKVKAGSTEVTASVTKSFDESYPNLCYINCMYGENDDRKESYRAKVNAFISAVSSDHAKITFNDDSIIKANFPKGKTTIIDGKSLYGQWKVNTRTGAESSSLAGRGDGDNGNYGFGLIYLGNESSNYINKANQRPQTAEEQEKEGGVGVVYPDGTAATVDETDFEIVIQQNGDYILPTTREQGICPKEHDETTHNPDILSNIVNLYNITMSDGFITKAKGELVNETKKYIEDLVADNDSRTFKSNPVAFKENNPDLHIGQSIGFVDGKRYTASENLATRVIKLVTKLDYNFEQEITVGNKVIKGTQRTLKEKVDTIVSGNAGSVGGGGGVSETVLSYLMQTQETRIQNWVRSWVEGRYLSRINEDRAQEHINFRRGITVGDSFVSGLLGEGGVFRKEADGTTYIEADKLYIRMKAYFDTVEIRKYEHSTGNRVASNAGIKAVRIVPMGVYEDELVELDYDGHYYQYVFDEKGAVVEKSDPVSETIPIQFYRCYFRAEADDQEVENFFKVGDLAYCKATKKDNTNIHYFWRVVIACGTQANEDGEMYIDLSNRSLEVITERKSSGGQTITINHTIDGSDTGSDAPYAQDDIVQLGHVYDKERQGAIIEMVNGVNAPAYQIYQGIDNYSLNQKNYINLYYDSQNGRAKAEIYGDAYIGDRNGSTYIRYDSAGKQLDIKARLNIESTIVDGQTITPISQFAKGHEVFCSDNGNCDSNGYPIPPYNEGDLWVNAVYPASDITIIDEVTQESTIIEKGSIFNKEIAVCLTDNQLNVFDIDDWKQADKLHEYGYISDALKAAQYGYTSIEGGLLLSSYIALKDTENTPNVWSGISGIYHNENRYLGHGIASWYGGDAIDREAEQASHANDNPAWVEPVWGGNYRYAKSLFRFDGSGYVAGGNLSWSNSGELTIKSVKWGDEDLKNFFSAFQVGLDRDNLRITPQGAFTELNVIDESNFLVGGEWKTVGDKQIWDTTNASVVATRNWVDTHYLSKDFFNSLFTIHAGSGELRPNGTFDNNVVYSIEAMFGFWTEKYISALGKNDSGGGGGGGAVTLEDLTDVEISSPAVGQVLKLRQNPTTGLYEWYNGSDEGVTSIDWSNITNKPSTFTPSAHNHDERYYINNGTIYLGGLSITPVTSLEGYATESYVNNNFLSTIGGSLNGDLTLNNASLIQQYMINPSDPEYAYLTIEDGIITLDSDGKIQTRDESYYFDNNGNAVFATLKVGVNDVWHAGNHPTTLGNYGITDAKIENGVITLGSNTIMPVTSVAMTMPTGLSVTGSPITKTGTFVVSYASGYEGFTTAWKNDIYDKVYAIFSWFEVDANGDIKTKDKPNNGGHRGFYSESFVSALGKNDASGSGGLDIDAMWSELMNIDNTKVIDISHIPTIPTSKINNLIGYVTDCLTDYASIAGNTIYIGEDSLNLNNYLPLIGGGMDGNIYWQYSGRRTTRLEIGQHTLSTTADYDYYLSAMAGGGLSPLFGVRTDGTVEAVRYIIGSDLTIDNEYIAYHYENAAGTIEKDANISLEYGFHYESKNGATTKYTNIIDDHITLSSGTHAVNIISTGMTIDGNAVRHAGDTYYSGGSLVVGGVTVPLSSGDYLLKSGDTMTGNLTMGNEHYVIAKNPRKRSDGGGWDVSSLKMTGNNDAAYFAIGAYGVNDMLNYVYLGSNAYDSVDNLRIYPNGDVGVGDNAVIFSYANSQTWNIEGVNSGIRILNAAGTDMNPPRPAGAPGDYHTALSVCGYYGFQIAVYGGTQGGLMYRKIGSGDVYSDSDYDFSWHELANTDDLAGYATTSALNDYLNKSVGGYISGDITLGGSKLTQTYNGGSEEDPESCALVIEDGVIILDTNGKIQTGDGSYFFGDGGYAAFYSLNVGDNLISHTSDYLELGSVGNEILIDGSGATTMYINYRPSANNMATPTTFVWNAGSSSSYADHQMGDVIASGFAKRGGTSTQFLKADGSVDSNTYATTSALNGYLPLTAGSTAPLTGDLYMGTNKLDMMTVGNVGTILNHEKLEIKAFGAYGEQQPNTTVTAGSITVNGNAVWHAGNLTPHSHSNKSVLDGITSAKVNNWDAAYGWGNHASAGYLKGYNSGTGITIASGYVSISDAYLTKINNADSDRHTHSNKSVLDGITPQHIDNWDSAFDVSHTHGNLSVLNGITAAKVTNWDNALTTYASSGTDNLQCLQNAFASVPKSVATAVRLEHGSHSMAIGWFLTNYNYDHAYGGWFISDYSVPSWVGVADGVWTTCSFVTSNNISSYLSGYATTSALSGYLPLSGGGEITSGDYSLGVSENKLEFKYNNTVYGSISLDYGIDGAEFNISSNATLGGETIATQSWVGQQGYVSSSALNGYLSLSGGTMTGAIRMNTNAIKLGYSGSGSSEQANAMNAILNNQSLTFNNNTTVEFGQPKPKTTIEAGTIATTGSITVNGNTVWHAGNLTPHSHSNKSVLDGITSAKVNNWDAAYGWGNHAAAGYLTSGDVKHVQNSYTISSEIGTVGQAKTEIISRLTEQGYGVGDTLVVSESCISQWNNDNATCYPSSVYSMTKIGGGYNGSEYGQWLLSTYGDERIGYVGRRSNNWTPIRWIATTEDLKGRYGNFYNFVAQTRVSSTGWCKFTFPHVHTTSANNRWFMLSFDLVLGGSYQGAPNGTVHVRYYFYSPAGSYANDASTGEIYATGVGCALANLRICYDNSDSANLYVYMGDQYADVAIKNLTAEDSARYDYGFDYRDTKASEYNAIPYNITDITIHKLYGSTSSLYHNGNVMIDAGNISNYLSGYATTNDLSSYLPLIGGNISGTLNVKGAGTAFTVDNDTELSGTLYVDGITTLNDNLNVDDDITITSLEKGIVFYSGNYIKTNTSNWLVVNGGDDIHFNIGGETMMFVDDTGTYADSYHNISDIRKKDVVRYDALPDFDDVWRAPAIAFRWKEKMDGGVHLGSVAQYWETILPETVHEDKNGYLSMQYDVIALLAAIATARKVQNHEERIAELEHENEILRNEVEQLKAV